ncbi:MAG: AMP nucleosidase [Alloprevotella sp.]|nr:AMP nucleosidase [Alloprevotella sp.]
MKTREEIVGNWLQRYTGKPLSYFGGHVLLTNFNHYVDLFCEEMGVDAAEDADVPFRAVTADGITMINFGIGSPNAALIMDLLSAIAPSACLFLGKCGGISDKTQLGDYILPLAGIRGEGTSNDYFPPEVPALPAFMLQRAVSTALRNNDQDYWTGTIYTTNRRVWEHDEKFKQYLRETRAMGVDMETATLFSCGFYNHIPTGALLLVSDNPMVPEGIKTSASDRRVTQNFARTHVHIGVEAMRLIIGRRSTVRHLKFDW